MMALNRYRLRHLANEGHRGAKLTSLLLAKTDRLLGVILLGNNLMNAAAAMLVGEITRRYLGDSEITLAIATGLVTFIILVFAEVTPKIVGASYPERIAYPSSFLLAPLLRLFYPAVWFVNLFVRSLLWVLRIKPTGAESENVLGVEELRTVIQESSQYIPSKHRSILLNLFELENITVDDVMTPRNQIEAIDLESPSDLIAEQLATSLHSRLLVCQGQMGDIIGILPVKRLLHDRSRVVSAEALQELVQEPYFIPSGTPLFTQLQQFQENHRGVGLVVDEYGELLGLITLEDILEEIVGEFATQVPSQSSAYHPQEDGSWLVEGTAPLRDLNRRLGFNLPLEGPRTLNGLILEHLEDIPEPGTSLKIANHPMDIVQTQDRVIKVVRIFPALPEQ